MSLERPHYHVIYRACDAVKAVNGGDRPFGLNKTELVEICFKSLYKSIEKESFEITVVGDKLSKRLQDFFKQYPVKLVEGEFGAAKSLLYCFNLALKIPDEYWIYFCEDDYLHVKESFEEVSSIIRNKKNVINLPNRNKFESLVFGNPENCDIFIHLPDYPDRYEPKYIKPSFLFLNGKRHWRQITSTTHSFICQAKSFKKRKKIFSNEKLLDKDWKMSKKIYADRIFREKVLSLSPIP